MTSFESLIGRSDIFAPFHSFGAEHGKPMIVAEWGVHEDPADPDRAAT